MKFGKKMGIPLTSLALGTLVSTLALAAEQDPAKESSSEKETQVENNLLGDSKDQAGDNKEPKAKPETMQVWGTKIWASSEPIDEDYLALKQPDHISDLLRIIPGVDVGGAHSLNQRITIRSMDDKDIEVTIDGARQNSYMYHHMGNLQIHADILESAAIEVGKSSVLNGGLGGGAYFETKTAEGLLFPDQRWGGFGKVSYGDNWGSSYALSTYGKIASNFDFLAYYNHVERIDYQVGGSEIQDKDGQEISGTDGKVRGLEGTLDDYLLKFGWNITPDHRFDLSREVYLDQGDYSYRPDMGLATGSVISEKLKIPLTFPTKFDRETTVLKYTGELPGTLITATAYLNDSTFWRDEEGLAAWRPALAMEKSGEAKNLGGRILAESKFEFGVPQTLRYGGDYTEYSTSYQEKGSEISAEKAFLAAFYAEDEINFADRIRLTPGLRHDQANLDSATTKDEFSQLTYALKADFDVTKNWKLIASSTQLFKAPEIGEAFIGAGFGEIENPDIKAQTGANSEVRLQYDQFVRGAGSFKGGVTYFDTRVKDYIYEYASLPGGTPGQAWKDNVGDLNITGYEAYLRYDYNQFSILLTHSTSASDLSAFDEYIALDGARIDREQGPTTSLSLDYSLTSQPISLHWDALSVASLDAGKDLDVTSLDDANSKDAYAVHNVSARWLPRIGDSLLDVTLGIDNVFDEYYASQSSRTGVSFHPVFQNLYLTDYEPGRSYKATVGYKF